MPHPELEMVPQPEGPEAQLLGWSLRGEGATAAIEVGAALVFLVTSGSSGGASLTARGLESKKIN